MTTNPMRFFSPTMRTSTLVFLGIALLANIQSLYANDSAAEVAVGGIQLRKETRISMEKERLTISLRKVTVEYEFLNMTDQDITTKVAFPIPPYEFTPESGGGVRDFRDFHVWVDGKEVKYQALVRARFKSADYTPLLRRLGVEIETFGQFPIPDYDVAHSQIGKLPKAEQQKLIRLGLTDEDGFPRWSVVKTYYWSQRFPAKKILRVRHEYEPSYGFEPFHLVDSASPVSGPCADQSLETKLRGQQAIYSQAQADKLPPLTHVSWVKYILTTANSWKTPIKDFELVVEPLERWGPDPKPKFLGTRVCWDGEVRPAGKGRFIARRFNYVPSSELSVYYFEDYN